MISNALKGVKVVDFTQLAAGPTCSLMLADLGADVIKIEAPSGDVCRTFAPHLGQESVYFMALNASKRSVVLDLKKEDDASTAMTLAANADVVLESFRPGVMARLGFGYDAIAKVNPRVVFCSISGFGQEGPWKDLPGVDGILQALTGLMSISGAPGMPPSKAQVPIVDIVTGYLAATAVLAALHQRTATGAGQHLDVNMFSSAIALQQATFASYFATRDIPGPLGSAAPYSAPNEALRCADGWIMVAAYQPERWRTLCRIIGSADLADSPLFATLKARLENRRELNIRLELLLAAKTVNEWQKLFQEADIICGGICNYQQVQASPQFAALHLKERVTHPTVGVIEMPRFNLGVGARPGTARRPAPTLGQHTGEIMAEVGALKVRPVAPEGTSRNTKVLHGHQV